MKKLQLTREAHITLEAIGRGYRLRVPHNPGESPRLKDDPRRPHSFGQVPVPPSVVAELLASGLLYKLTEHGEGQRIGWRAMGFTDGHQADYWVPMQ